MNAQHTPGPRLSSVQRFALKQFLLGWPGIRERHYNRTRDALFGKGLLTAPNGGELTDAGRAIAKDELEAERARRAAIAKATGSTS